MIRPRRLLAYLLVALLLAACSLASPSETPVAPATATPAAADAATLAPAPTAAPASQPTAAPSAAPAATAALAATAAPAIVEVATSAPTAAPPTAVPAPAVPTRVDWTAAHRLELQDVLAKPFLGVEPLYASVLNAPDSATSLDWGVQGSNGAHYRLPSWVYPVVCTLLYERDHVGATILYGGSIYFEAAPDTLNNTIWTCYAPNSSTFGTFKMPGLNDLKTLPAALPANTRWRAIPEQPDLAKFAREQGGSYIGAVAGEMGGFNFFMTATNGSVVRIPSWLFSKICTDQFGATHGGKQLEGLAILQGSGTSQTFTCYEPIAP